VGEKKMTDDELRELVASLALAQVKTDAQLAKTDAKLNKLAEMYGGVGNNQGRVIEEFYYNSLKHNPVLNGIQFDFIEKNVTRSKGGIEEEYDLLLVNGQEIYIVEVKYRLHPKDIERMVGRKLTNFKKLFPEYQNYRIHLALATFAVEDDVKQLALDNGVTLLQRRGDVIETLAA
jgi:Holliday junction resolvase-like predicted endonuclease